MSRNKFMHPRNPFKVKPDYTDLAIKYSSFRKMCKLRINGKVTINLKDNSALEALTKTLLEEYFGLKMEVPKSSLVPTIPLRLNYILWIEDLLEHINEGNINGIDIGCGASCIYCLLCSRKNNWTMIGLETNNENVAFAKRNVEINNLTSKITIFHQKQKDVIFKDFFKTMIAGNFTFCICNPPFFDYNMSNSDAEKRTDSSAYPRGKVEELSYGGGERKFIANIIDESLEYGDRIKVFSTMVGRKCNVKHIVNMLQSRCISSYKTTEFCQGNVTRWGIMWYVNKSLSQTQGVHFSKTSEQTFKEKSNKVTPKSAQGQG